MSARAPKVYVHLFYGKDAETYRQNYMAGKEPDESPYGFHLARELGYEVAFSRDTANGLFLRILRKIFGFDVLHAYTNRARVREADVVWVMTEGEAFAVALLFALGLAPRRPIVANAVWLLNNWRRTPFYRRALYRFLSRYLGVLTVHSAKCLPIAREAFPDLRTEVMYFGVNTDLFRITPPAADEAGGPLRIFAPGNDRTRDWDTLLAAFGRDSRFHLTIICGWLGDEQLRAYPNVTAVRAPTMGDFIRCYEDADLVAVPMKENIFSGITVALEAAAKGKPILSTRTGGVPTYFEEEDVFYAPVGDPAAMRETVLATTPQSRRERAESAQRRFLAHDYSTRALIRRYAELTRELLG